jgi:hypothetical protein
MSPVSHVQAGMEFLCTIRADAMAELSLRTIPDVDFYLIPIALVVPYLAE